MASEYAAAKQGAPTPLTSGNGREAARYEHDFSKEASREWFIAEEAYCAFVDDCNSTGILLREKTNPTL